MRRGILSRPLLVIALTLSAACSAPQPPLVATDVEITRPIPGMNMGAGFLVLTNNTNKAIRITQVTSPQFAAIEIHETTLENGVSRMRRLDVLEVPAHGSVTLARGGKHLMLMRPRDLQDAVSLRFMSGKVPALTVEYSFEAGKR